MSTFVDSFSGYRDFLSVGCSLKDFNTNFMAGLQLQQSLTNESLSQVSLLFCCVVFQTEMCSI